MVPMRVDPGSAEQHYVLHRARDTRHFSMNRPDSIRFSSATGQL
jgi:hypothetical protein